MVKDERMVRELTIGAPNQYEGTVRARPETWDAGDLSGLLIACLEDCRKIKEKGPLAFQGIALTYSNFPNLSELVRHCSVI